MNKYLDMNNLKLNILITQVRKLVHLQGFM